MKAAFTSFSQYLIVPDFSLSQVVDLLGETHIFSSVHSFSMGFRWTVGDKSGRMLRITVLLEDTVVAKF